MAYKQEASVDPLDMDRYIDFDQAVTYPSPSISPSTTSRGKTIAAPEFHTRTPDQSYLASQLSIQSNFDNTFAGPSHQYDQFKQNTGLPVGAIQSTLAVNPPNTLGFGGYQSGLIPPVDGFFNPNVIDDDLFDFNTVPSHNPSFSSATDDSMDFDSPTSDLLMPTLNQSASFIDPNAVGGQEEISPLSTPVQRNPPKVWPGMHQQQAAIAKAQAAQRQQQQLRMAQPHTSSTQRRTNSKAPANNARPAADPIVEERISRLLNQMRQNSEAASVSSSHEDALTPTASGGMSHSARQRKDEEDMDEDERLLASEEGKKLSSKERRQLRNKVSARAFRSRRKEYIGQLEGEISAKAQEADDLRAENEALKAENTRLTDLTRMLLSSTAFSSFLNDLSSTNNPMTAPPSTTTAAPAPSAPQQARPVRKDANPYQRQLQSQPRSGTHVGMTLVPETPTDFSAFSATNNIWNDTMDFGFNNARVFSVTELPQGPAVDSVDIGILSGKSSSYTSETKEDMPALERMPINLTEEKANTKCEEIELDAANPAFALFLDYAAEPTSSLSKSEPNSISPTESSYQVFGSIAPEKAFARIDLIVTENDFDEDGMVHSAVMDRFQRLCSEAEAASMRVAAITAHLGD